MQIEIGELGRAGGCSRRTFLTQVEKGFHDFFTRRCAICYRNDRRRYSQAGATPAGFLGVKTGFPCITGDRKKRGDAEKGVAKRTCRGQTSQGKTLRAKTSRAKTGRVRLQSMQELRQWRGF